MGLTQTLPESPCCPSLCPASPSNHGETRLRWFCVRILPQHFLIHLGFRTQCLVLGVMLWEVHWQIWENHQVVRGLGTIFCQECQRNWGHRLEKRGHGEQAWPSSVLLHWERVGLRPERHTCYLQPNPKIHISQTNPSTVVQTIPRNGKCLFI